MDASNSLQHGLRAARYERAVEASTDVLRGIGVSAERPLDLSEVDDLWPRYVARLRAGGDARERWPVEQVEGVRRRVDGMREAMGEVSVVWLTLVDSEPVGVVVRAGGVIDAGLGYLVSSAGDLMVTTPDLADGACVELNHLATGDEYEIVSWGRLAP